MRIKRDFFNRSALKVARDILGQVLIRKIGSKTFRYIITETEAYCGVKDLACHASKGRTKRTETMFGPPGHAYVYLIYGMYHCLNIVTKEDGGAVLVRGIKGISGPGKICRELKINKEMNGLDLISSNSLWLEKGKKPKKIILAKRIGVEYAKAWKEKKYRFIGEH